MSRSHYTLEDFDFSLPDKLIAQYPLEERDESRLFVLHRDTKRFEHIHFKQIIDLLKPGDLLVFNNARVINARVFCKRDSGGMVELILLEKRNDTTWISLCSRKKRIKVGETLHPIHDTSIFFTVEDNDSDSIKIKCNIPLDNTILLRIGVVPLPLYIKREAVASDSIKYQTVYASEDGAVASPTAGLHFTNDLLDQLKKRGVDFAFLTLFVSWGTFQPVRTVNIHENRIHREEYVLTEKNAAIINDHRKKRQRIIAVGTTTLRVLESTFKDGINIPGRGTTDIFIYPPYVINSVDGLITNFHTPRSSLIMLVSAFAGYETTMEAYKTAIDMNYRFFSYGDCMYII